MDTYQSFLTFEINNEQLAIPMENVVEVLIDKAINPIPKVKDYICGIINYRNEAISAIDILRKIGYKNSGNINYHIQIVTELKMEDKVLKLACICDTVHQIETIKISEIQSAPEFGSNISNEFLKGAFYINDELFYILDIKNIILDE